VLIDNTLQGDESVLSRDAWGKAALIINNEIYPKGYTLDEDQESYDVFISTFRQGFTKFTALTRALPVLDEWADQDEETPVYPYHAVLPLKRVFAAAQKNGFAVVVDFDTDTGTIISIFNDQGQPVSTQVVSVSNKDEIKTKVEEICSNNTIFQYELIVLNRKELQKKLRFINPYKDVMDWEGQKRNVKTYSAVLILITGLALWQIEGTVENYLKTARAEKQATALRTEVNNLKQRLTFLKQKIENPEFAVLLEREQKIMELVNRLPNSCTVTKQLKNALVVNMDCYFVLPKNLKKTAKIDPSKREVTVPF